MILYRVECKESGRGPFTDFHSDLVWMDKFSYENRFEYPTPDHDKIINRSSLGHEKVACISREQLDYWFKEHYSDLLANGFNVVEIEVPRQFVTIGDKQCLYNYEETTDVRIVKE